MVYPKAYGKTAHSTCNIARALGSQVTSSLMLLNIGNLHLPWVHVLGSTSKGHADAEMMEGEGFLQKYSLCTHNSLTSVDCVEMTVLQTWNSRNFWMQKDASTETCAELIPQLQRHPTHKHWLLYCYRLLYGFLQGTPLMLLQVCWNQSEEDALTSGAAVRCQHHCKKKVVCPGYKIYKLSESFAHLDFPTESQGEPHVYSLPFPPMSSSEFFYRKELFQ